MVKIHNQHNRPRLKEADARIESLTKQLAELYGSDKMPLPSQLPLSTSTPPATEAPRGAANVPTSSESGAGKVATAVGGAEKFQAYAQDAEAHGRAVHVSHISLKAPAPEVVMANVLRKSEQDEASNAQEAHDKAAKGQRHYISGHQKFTVSTHQQSASDRETPQLPTEKTLAPTSGVTRLARYGSLSVHDKKHGTRRPKEYPNWPAWKQKKWDWQQAKDAAPSPEDKGEGPWPREGQGGEGSKVMYHYDRDHPDKAFMPQVSSCKG